MPPTVNPPKPSILDKLLAPLPGQRERQSFFVPRVDRFSEGDLRAAIRRDIAWLLNEVQFGAAVPLDDYPEVHTAVLNHGLPDVVGRSIDQTGMAERAGQIVAAVRAFEQRLRPDTVRVTFESARADSDNRLHFTIQGEIRNAIEESWLELATSISLDDGHVEVAR